MSDNGAITWVTETRRLGDLIPWEDNPRQLTKDQAKRLERSLKKFGYSQLVEIEPDDTFLDGHQRDDLMKIMDEFGPDAQIECRVANRKFTLKERKEYIGLKHEGATGEWNWDQMHNLYDFDELVDYGFDVDQLEAFGFMPDEDEPEDSYSRNIEAPIYTPKGEKPIVGELYNETRTKELLSEIDKADLPDEEKEFLRNAARRHTVFNYKRIAEYYAHSDETTQALMEDSALVIIDFDKAIELGYVKLSKEIANQYRIDYGTE